MSNHRHAETVEASSGNVFSDLGLPDPEERLLKAKLATEISGLIEQTGWTQSQAHKHVGLDEGSYGSFCMAGFPNSQRHDC
jgi:predicted XRE-type DNA-binding protein